MQESRGLRLIAATLVERSLNQLDLVSFDLTVEIDAADWLNAVLIVVELSLQRFDFTGEGFCEQDELIKIMLSTGLHAAI